MLTRLLLSFYIICAVGFFVFIQPVEDPEVFARYGKELDRPAPVQVVIAEAPAGEGLSVITTEDGIVTGNTLARWGELCTVTPVYGGPDTTIYDPLYEIPDGTLVRLHELSRGEDRSWVMIEPARWIRISALCTYKEN